MGASFGAYVMVDWSAAKVPVQGKDSIWIACIERDETGALHRTLLENPMTRAAATARIADLLSALADAGKRVLAGFDFPFGYPRGTGAALGHGGLIWRRIWAEIRSLLQDDDRNQNNRFEVGAALNKKLSGEAFPFWGHDGQHECDTLKAKDRRPHNPEDVPERRLCETRLKRTQSVWKLAYTGSVGSQTLTGLPRIWALRTDPRLAFRTQIWPFETGLADCQHAEVILAEVYPSLVEPDTIPGLPKDAGQVSALATAMAEWDQAGRLPALFAGDPNLDKEQRACVETEEAWILGLTDRPEPRIHTL